MLIFRITFSIEFVRWLLSIRFLYSVISWTSEESYGALLAFRFVLAEVLGAKIKDGYFSLSDDKIVIDNLMIRNAAGLYGLKQV